LDQSSYDHIASRVTPPPSLTSRSRRPDSPT
jgi:hypothetical protein